MQWAPGFTVSVRWRRQGSFSLSTVLLSAYFVNLGLSHEEASELHLKYYTQYGLALRGLTKHHDVGSAVLASVEDLIDSMLPSRPFRL